jgi:glutaredoxin
MSRAHLRLACSLLLLALLLATFVACKRQDPEAREKASAAPKSNELPALELRDTAPGEGGKYSVKTLSRSEWDELGASRRKARLEAFAPSSAPAPSSEAPAGSGEAPSAKQAPGKNVVAVIYGAEWCKPCHDAARYLKQRGVTVVEKDIEASEVAAAEMRKKLERAKMPAGSSIPIIDVMGNIMVGFSPRALERAIQAAESAKPL